MKVTAEALNGIYTLVTTKFCDDYDGSLELVEDTFNGILANDKDKFGYAEYKAALRIIDIFEKLQKIRSDRVYNELWELPHSVREAEKARQSEEDDAVADMCDYYRRKLNGKRLGLF